MDGASATDTPRTNFSAGKRPAIAVRGLCKHLGGSVLYDDFNLDIPQGQDRENGRPAFAAHFSGAIDRSCPAASSSRGFCTFQSNAYGIDRSWSAVAAIKLRAAVAPGSRGLVRVSRAATDSTRCIRSSAYRHPLQIAPSRSPSRASWITSRTRNISMTTQAQVGSGQLEGRAWSGHSVQFRPLKLARQGSSVRRIGAECKQSGRVTRDLFNANELTQ